MMKTKEELLGNPSLVLLLNGDVREFGGLAKKDVMNIESAAFTIGEVDKILNAPTEEQVKCEFCHGGRKAKPIVNDSSEFLAFDKNGIVAFGNDGSVTTGEEYTRIKYCPMCGRYLD